MTDFRALCGELLEELLARPLIIDLDLIDRARAALDAAPDSPAVPEGKKTEALPRIITMPLTQRIELRVDETFNQALADLSSRLHKSKAEVIRDALNYYGNAVDEWDKAHATPPPPALPPSYIDPEHQGDDRELLQVFYQACNSEGGTADEIHLRGIRAVLAALPTLAEPVGEKPVAWLWEHVGSNPYPGKGTLVARSLQEMDPDFPPYPDHWRPLKPLYAHALPLPSGEVDNG